jgi:hypothetical protein
MTELLLQKFRSIDDLNPFQDPRVLKAQPQKENPNDPDPEKPTLREGVR